MKKMLRITTFILACLMMIAVFAGCNSEQEKTTTAANANKPSGGETTEAVEPPPVEDKNYETDFNFLDVKDCFPKDYFFATEQTDDVMNNAVYTRQLTIKESLGVDITVSLAEVFTEYKETFETSVKSGDQMYQGLLTHVNVGVAPLVTAGVLFDFNDFESVNLDKDYWNKSLMESLAYNDNLYLAYGDFCLAYTYAIAYNKDLLNKYCANSLGDDSIYDLVRNYQWTLDKMIELATMAHKDKNGDGIKDTTDIYGIAGYMWVDVCSLLHSSGINITEKNASTGKYEITINANKDKIENLVAKVNEIYTGEYSAFYHPFENGNPSPSVKVEFKDGTSLFNFFSTYQLVGLKSTNVKFGVLPYPTYDEAQREYRHLSWSGYLAVPYNIDEVEMVSDTLELLQYYSSDVTTIFYEKLLGAQVSDSPDDADMLDIIWDTLVSDYALAYSAATTDSKLDALVYSVPRIILNVDQSTTFAAYWARYGKKASKDLSNLQKVKK